MIQLPEEMYKLFEGYKKQTKSNPFLVHDYVGKDGKSVYREKQRCLTMEGFHCYVADQIGYPNHIDQYFSNREGRYSDFVGICSRIREEIRRDQIEGGMAGIYNPSITQRLNNLVEKSEHTVKTETPLFGDEPED